MCLTEYNEAEVMEMFKEEGREEGREKVGRTRRGTGRRYSSCHCCLHKGDHGKAKIYRGSGHGPSEYT